MARQRSDGPAFEIYAELAAGFLAPDELTGYLREQVARRPDWPVAWCAAIRQLASTGAVSEAADLAAEAGARFPLSSEVWLVRAQLNGAREDEAAEISCLDEALRIQPGHSAASCHLAARLHGRGESARARSLLHQALALAPFEARNHQSLAHLLWAEGEYEACLEESRLALLLSPGNRFARELLVACAQHLARPRVAIELARDLCAREPRNVSLLLWLAELLEGQETLQERIRLGQRAVELEPNSVPARNLLAFLLVEAGRHKDALAACSVRRFPGSDPFLPARAAWVEAERGQLTRAIEQMESILARYEDFLWGWEQLAEWNRVSSDDLGYLRCAERLAELDPDVPASHARLGHARLSVRDRGGAIAALRRAVELKPDYTIAAVLLLDAQIDDRDLAGAQSTLTQAQAVADDPRILAKAVVLACLRKDESPAFDRMGLLLRRCGQDADSLERALRALHVAWPRKADDLMARIPEMDPVGQAAIAEWAKRRLAAKSWRRAVRDAEATRRPEFVRVALEVVAKGLDDQVKAGAFRRMVRAHRGLLSQNTEAWAKVLEGLVRHSLRRDGVAWCAGWDRREGLQPWMLWNVSVLLREAGLEKDLARVHQRALALGEDHTTVMHHVWLAAESALDGSPEFASAYLRSFGASEEPAVAFVIELTQAVLAGLPGSADTVPFPEVRRRFAHSRRELGRLERRDLRRLYRRCLHRVAAARGGVRGWAWYLAARAVS